MIDELLNELRRREIHIWSEGDRLKYEAPPGTLTDDLLALLRHHKEAVLQRCRAVHHSSFAPIPRIDRGGSLPLSFSQQRMWFLWRLAPNSPAYNIPTVIRISGRLNVDALVRSLRKIQQRHEVLRTHFVETSEGPSQVIEQHASLDVQVIELLHESLEENEAEARRLTLNEIAKPFDLSRTAPFVVRVYRLSDTVHWLLIKLHHIVFDGWSNQLFMTELYSIYESFDSGKECELPELTVQYADFAAWQRTRLQGPHRETLLAYWKERLRGGLNTLKLPTDRPSSSVPSMRGDSVPFSIPPELAKKLSELCQRRRVTMFMALMSALRVLLHRYSGQADFLIGTPTIRRLHYQTEQLIGYFGNTLVLRNPILPDDTFLQVLEREREAALSAYEHQEIPFDALVEEVAPDRSASRSPLFQVMFLFGERAPDSYEVVDLTFQFLQLAPTTAKFDLGLWVMQTETGLSGHFEYPTDLFERETVEQMTAHFEGLIEAMGTHPEMAVGRMPLLTPAEEHLVLKEWNATAREISHRQCLHELFETHVKATPDAPAIYFGADQITYSELNVEANRLAHRLLSLGAHEGQLIGVCLRRTPRLIAALLAVLKTGAAYVPTDPDYPSERINLILNDSNVKVLITEHSAGLEIPSGEFQLLLVDDHEAREQQPNPENRARPDSLAYVIYTSGSTGRPKGVLIEHRNAVALLEWAYSCYDKEELDVVLAATSCCFDLSIFELFVPLCGGHSVVLAKNALELFSLPAKDSITLINTVPSVMRSLLRVQGAEFPASLLVVNLAGELLETDVVDNVYSRTGAKKVYDLYGPSETTTYSTFKLRLPQRPPSIGRPISNTRAYVLDNNGMPVPIGVLGELYLAGDGLARGYLNDSDLTNERFVPPPSASIPEQRLYRTGDLVKLRRNGEIEYHGRNDDQVKVRGFRIEPGEVRAALLTAAGVNDALVVSRTGSDGEPYLAAYLAGDATRFSAKALNSHLKKRLPAYLIPTVFVPVEEFPLGPNGKVDLGRLDQPKTSRDLAPDEIPETETEQQLATIWKDVLNAQVVGIHDSFFDLGGHSMPAMLALGRINRTFSTDVPLSAIFEYPTIYELAGKIEAVPRGLALPPLRVRESTDAPATLLQSHLWLVHHTVEDPAFLNIWEHLGFKGTFELWCAELALAALIRRHPILRAKFVRVGNELRQRIEGELPLNIFFEDLSDLPDEERRREFAALCYRIGGPFDTAKGPCFRFQIVRLAPDNHILIMVLHHIIVDEWSLSLLSKEFAACYTAFRNGLPAPLSPPNITFTDYAFWENECRVNGLFNQQLDFWMDKLKPPLSRLSFSWQNEMAGANEQIESYQLEIPEALTERLVVLARQERASLFVVLLSALKRLLQRQAGLSDIRVSTNVARRHRSDLEKVVGPLTDTFVLRTTIPDDHTALSALRLVRSNFIEACGYQDIPFGEIAARLVAESGIRLQDLAQAFFLFEEEAEASLPMPALSATTDNDAVKLRGDFFTAALHNYDVILFLQKSAKRIRGQLTLRGELSGGVVANELTCEYLMLLEELAETRASEVSARLGPR